MAAMFKTYKLRLGGATAPPDLLSDTIKIALIDTGTTDPLVDTHDFYDDISSAVVGTPQTLGSKTYSYSTPTYTFDAADAVFSALTGNSVEEFVIYHDTGTPSTSLLICQMDAADVTNFAYTPDGSQLTIVFASTGIFTIG